MNEFISMNIENEQCITWHCHNTSGLKLKTILCRSLRSFREYSRVNSDDFVNINFIRHFDDASLVLLSMGSQKLW